MAMNEIKGKGLAELGLPRTAKEKPSEASKSDGMECSGELGSAKELHCLETPRKGYAQI